MPSKSEKQKHLMAAAAHNPEFAKKVGVPQKVAKEFFRADQKMKQGGVGRMKSMRTSGHVPHAGGLISSDVPGRTDKLPISVGHGAYIIPADVVSSLGEGNTSAGAAHLDSITGNRKKMPHFAKGGTVDIIVAGGEYHVPPDDVTRIGDGNINHGHQILDALVKHVRSENIKTQKNLPDPKK